MDTTPKYMNLPKFKENRQQLRKNGTSAEAVLWRFLKNKQIDRLKFRRQQSIGNYIVDFYCPKLRLAIELDGDYHYHLEQPARDLKRDEELWEQAGVRVLRFENKEVFYNIEGIINCILQEKQLQQGGEATED